MPDKISVAIVDDHLLFRKGIATLLEEFDNIEVVFDAANGRELEDKLPGYTSTDVILMDINMPVTNGYEATAWVKKRFPHVRVLALSMFDEDEAVIGMLRAGAGGYVLKESSPVALHKAIEGICANGFYVTEQTSGRMIRNLQGDDEVSTQLSKREIEFLQWCATELTYKEIAVKMNIAPRSVENYRENAFEKLGVKSRVGLVLYAISRGIVKVPTY
jgi:DNA-binding NarL/FixJ family response regulator